MKNSLKRKVLDLYVLPTYGAETLKLAKSSINKLRVMQRAKIETILGCLTQYCLGCEYLSIFFDFIIFNIKKMGFETLWAVLSPIVWLHTHYTRRPNLHLLLSVIPNNNNNSNYRTASFRFLILYRSIHEIDSPTPVKDPSCVTQVFWCVSVSFVLCDKKQSKEKRPWRNGFACIKSNF